MKRIALIILSAFVGVSSLGGGYGLISTNGLGMPLSWVENSFGSYIIPGLVLFFIVGGFYIFSTVAQWKQYKKAPIYSAIAGFGLLIWIFTELYLIGQAHWLQILYFGIGILTLIFAILELENRN